MASEPAALGYCTVSLAERPDLKTRHDETGGAAWPEFMLHDPVAIKNWYRLIDVFDDCQLTILDGGDIAAVANAVPLSFDAAFEDLPDRGVEWGVEKSLADHAGGVPPNTLMGVQVVVAGTYTGRGLSAIATGEMLALARRKKLASVIVPVRPNQKARFPLIPMEDYIAWRTEDGLPYDGWLRVHARAGGRIIRICPDSMRIPGSVAEWSEWTGLEFPGSGRYIIPGALTPVEIDIERDRGLYVEPNVWVVHDLDP